MEAIVGDLSTKNEAIEEELIVLSSMYPDEFEKLPEAGWYQINVPLTNLGLPPIVLKWCYTEEYPSAPPIFTLSANWLHQHEVQKIAQCLDQQFNQQEIKGMTIHSWIEWITENLPSIVDITQKQTLNEVSSTPKESSTESEGVEVNDDSSKELKQDTKELKQDTKEWNRPVLRSEPLTDRKSKFVAHLTEVYSVSEVREFVDVLKMDKKIAEATHNILAYRIECTNDKGNTIIVLIFIFFPSNFTQEENRDDDGETGAGDQLLYMLQRLNAIDVCVVVTRWYGGIHLGPDRFKHIVNLGRELVQQYQSSSTSETPTTSNKESKTETKKSKQKGGKELKEKKTPKKQEKQEKPLSKQPASLPSFQYVKQKERTKDTSKKDIYFYSQKGNGRADPRFVFLSNFYESPFTINGKSYATVEHYFQSMKFKGEPYEETVRTAATPGAAKRLGRAVTLKRSDWDEVRDSVMLTALRAKFTQNEELKRLLLETNQKKLHEDSPSDLYWGIGHDNTGADKLGILLMQVRDEIRASMDASV